MKLLSILESYDTASLDQLSSDKIDEAISLRLPQSVIVQEIISALSSQSYISDKILYSRPPAFAILNLILQSPSFMMDIEDFRSKVLIHVKELSARADQDTSLADKNPKLYIKILKRAWENDGLIDKSEANILELVKSELGVWDREHFVLMHHTSILDLWNIEQEYFAARNFLLTTGIVLTHDNKYVIADDVAIPIRKTFGIELMDEPYKRLLNCFKREDLALLLGHYQLNVGGTKDILIGRILGSLIPVSDVLGYFNLEELREICRHENIPVAGSKSTVIANIIRFFDDEMDLKLQELETVAPGAPPEYEPREMMQEVYAKMLNVLTIQQLYDILRQNDLMTSGSKEEKIKRVMDSYMSERSIFSLLRKEDLSQLCRKFNLAVTGSKQELVGRLLDYVPVVAITTNELPVVINEVPALVTNTIGSFIPVSNSEPVALPIAWDEVNSKFPNYSYGEKIVLAILKDAKSITEQDLTRIVQKHRLGWFLHKAHMAELIAKLRRDNKQYIQIKSIQNNNIYQWTANDIADSQILEKKSARDIIDALRHGVVPKHNLDLLMVGQQTARKHLSDILMEVNANKTHFKFIKGQYGSGKTFLCSWLREFALNNEFAVSFMNISHDQPLSDLPIFFSGVINGLRTPEKTDSGALVDILESWLLNVHNKTARIEGIDISNGDNSEKLIKIVEKSIEVELANLNDIEPGFSQALRAFYEGKVTGNLELVSNAVAWIMGSRSLSAQALRDIGVKGILESNNVFPRMRALLEIINGASYKGLLLLVDELELVRKFPQARQREMALETLRLLIDEAGRNALPGCLIIFTGTDEFFEDERFGIKSYEALAERVLPLYTHDKLVAMRQPIISLEALDSERLSHVIFKIRDLYGIAYGWDANHYADDTSILKLIEEWTMFGGESIDRKPRPILREFIQMLDLCEENKGVYLSQFLKKNIFDSALVDSVNSN
ncbi:BREX system ATP-binding domain-containing protein [Chitinophaga sancti]|uniref:BREX system ATP-binding domain-containing protein n=1 Tax=Chitinophaga sancti TaxID=1004 RepID=A0A1K1SHZ3_9BACT|nr:BREX system ATP-binding domain-containing protein [Chitinophaga sancti]WQD61805.1 BREX system ATP-binding domain-containing protein [Chitinophaga sancti]WQG92626.1 BREX system ATP-binding domain-containing protein [Chitinophaga sancti]SFW83898.1 SAP domain-containing protein [Chitinophaga sancti]